MTAIDSLRRIGIAALLLGIGSATTYLGWTVQGWRMTAQLAALNEEIASVYQQAAQARADATERILEAERSAHTKIQQVTDQFSQQRNKAIYEKDVFIASVRSGAIRLSIPVATACTGTDRTDRTDSGVATGAGNEKRAELDPAAARFLDDIATEGDDAINTMNALIDAYNALREKLNVQARQLTQPPDQSNSGSTAKSR